MLSYSNSIVLGEIKYRDFYASLWEWLCNRIIIVHFVIHCHITEICHRQHSKMDFVIC